jgi:tetratricopeptide (TPR) repeat protein
LKPNRSLPAFRRRLFAGALFAALLYLLQPSPLLIAGEQDDRAKLSSLNTQVAELYQAGKFNEAIPIAQEAVELSEKATGPDRPDTALALTNLARLYKSLGDYAKAEPLFQRALKIDEKALGPDHPDTATALNNLGELYRSIGDYAKAEPLLKRALKIGGRRHGKFVKCPRCGALHYITASDVEHGYWICGNCGGGEIEPIEPGEQYQEAMPEFPWPPPKASASDTISRQLLLGSREHPLLGDAAAALDLAFRKAGYGERSYYSVPGGFAMASRIEQMNKDGTAKGLPDRWSLEVSPMREFSLSAYMSALFTARSGFYRVIVFVVSSQPFSQSTAKPTSEEAQIWESSGLNALPEAIASRDYTSAHRCTALIYEFKRTEGQHAEFVDPSEVTGQIHLEKSGLLAALKKR